MQPHNLVKKADLTASMCEEKSVNRDCSSGLENEGERMR